VELVHLSKSFFSGYQKWVNLVSTVAIGNPSGMCTKLRTVAASNSCSQSLLLLLARATYKMMSFFTHIPFVVNHTINATPPERLQRYHSNRRKHPFLLKFLNSCPPSYSHACVWEKVRDTPLKNWCNFKRSNNIRNSEILLNVIHNMKCLTDQFQLCFCFCIGNTKQLYFFLHWQHNWHPIQTMH